MGVIGVIEVQPPMLMAIPEKSDKVAVITPRICFRSSSRLLAKSEYCEIRVKPPARFTQNLNGLFGVAYRERRRFSVPQLGYLGY